MSAPADFVQSQEKEASTTTKNQFWFSEFETQFVACPVTKYEIVQSESLQTYPIGMDQLSQTSGTYFLPVLDGENPYYYSFTIKLTALGGNIAYFPASLTVKCPTNLVFLAVEYDRTKNSYVGANIATLGSEAIYQWPQMTAELPKCIQIIGYSIINESPSGKISYPSSVPCTEPCLEFDASEVGTITFQVQPLASLGSPPPSDTITITVTAERLPSIQNYLFNVSGSQESSFQRIEILSDEKFVFQPFECSDAGCEVNSVIQVSSSDTGLASNAEYDLSKGRFEVEVDTSVEAQYKFYLRAELKDLPIVVIFTKQLTAFVECGIDKITVTQSEIHLPAYPLTAQTQVFNFNVKNYFATTSPCEIKKVESSGSSLNFIHNSLESNDISFLASEGFVERISINAFISSSSYKTTDFIFTVCGQEQISLSDNLQSSFILQKDSIFQLEPLTFFTLSSSHPDCLLTPTFHLYDWTCSRPTSLVFSNFVFDTKTPFEPTDICLQIETVGKVRANKIVNVQVLGYERVVLKETKTVREVYGLGEGVRRIELGEQGVVFESETEYAEIVGYRLLDHQYAPVTGNQISLVETLTIRVDTSSPLALSTFYVAGYTQSSSLSDYQPISLKVCGLETISSLGDIQRTIAKGSSFFIIDLSSQLKSADPECPILQYKLELETENDVVDLKQSSTSVELFVYPNNFEELDTQEVMNFSVKAISKGNVSKRLNCYFKFVGQYQQKSPYFRKIEIKVVQLSIDSSGDAYDSNDNFQIPRIKDPFDSLIKPIDVSKIKSYRGTSQADLTAIPTPIWILNFECNFSLKPNCEMQDLWVSRIQSSGTAVSIEDIGFYKFEVVLENSNGYSGLMEQIFFTGI